MSTIKANTLTNVAGTHTFTTTELSAVKTMSNRNHIINGAMDIWQRGTSASGVGAGVYLADRWMTIGADTRSLSRVLSNLQSPLGESALRMEVTVNNGNYFGIEHRVETRIDMSAITLPTFTISCKVKTNSSDVTIRYYNGTTNVISAPHTGGGEYETLTLVVEGETATGTSYYAVAIDNYNNTLGTSLVGDYIELTQVQLELGTVATPFERLDVGTTLLQCQRYYQLQSVFRRFSNNSTITRHSAALQFFTEMRTIPSLVITNLTGIDVSGNIGTSKTYTEPEVTKRGLLKILLGVASYGWAGDLTFDAEL